MVLHFSGMRYKSAAWFLGRAEIHPGDALARADGRPGAQHERAGDHDACDQAVASLEAVKAKRPARRRSASSTARFLCCAFSTGPKPCCAISPTWSSARIEGFTDQQVLDRLEQLHHANPELPPVVLAGDREIHSIETENPGQELGGELSPLRWEFEERRWREILDIWQRQDITGWRAKHRNTLDLIVTRAVCNEIAEHIQHLRGVMSGAGLTAKPRFYNGKAMKTRNLPGRRPEKGIFQVSQESRKISEPGRASYGWVSSPTSPIPGRSSNRSRL